MAVETGHYFSIGDTLEIELDVIRFAQSVNSFAYSAVNETATRYFDFFFKYKINSSDFTGVAWEVLNTANLLAIVITPVQLLYLKLKIVRAGTDTTGDLELNSILINSTIEDQTDTFYPLIFSNSNHIFGYIKVADDTLLEYCNNILLKALNSIVPRFIDRTEHLYWYLDTITTYLSLYYVHAKKMNNYYYEDDLLLDFLQQKGLYFNGDESLAEMQLLCRNLFLEYKKRGTVQVIDEVKRLINYNDTEEFIFSLLNKNETGWYLNRTSVNFDELSCIRTINKMIEKDGNITDATNYFIVKPANTGIIADVDNDGNAITVLYINEMNQCGIQCTAFDVTDPRFMVVNPNFDYEISFRIKQITPATQYYFGINCFDIDGNFIDSVNLVSGAATTEFIKKDDPIIINPSDKYIKVKQIIYNSRESLRTAANAVLNIGTGQHLRFNPLTYYVYPIITTYASIGTVCDVRIYDIRVALNSLYPLQSFLQTSHILFALMKNNSESKTDEEINEIIDRYLIPANSILLSTFYTF